MSPMLSGLFIKGDNRWVVLANKTISVSLSGLECTGSKSQRKHTVISSFNRAVKTMSDINQNGLRIIEIKRFKIY